MNNCLATMCVFTLPTFSKLFSELFNVKMAWKSICAEGAALVKKF